MFFMYCSIIILFISVSVKYSNILVLYNLYAFSSLVTQTVKNLPTIQETQVQFLSQEHPLEKGVATHSSILAWRIPGTEEPGRLHTVHGVAKSQTQLSN